MPPMQGQIGGLFKAAFVIIQFWSLHREKILPVTGAISQEVHNPLVEQTMSQIPPDGISGIIQSRKNLSHQT